MEYKPAVSYPELLKGILDRVGTLDKLTDEQLKRLAGQKLELERLQRDSPISFYKPYFSQERAGYSPQDAFHRSEAKIRLFIGGNRSGKSTAGVVEDVWSALGIHPYRKVKTPNHGWIVSLDFPTSRDVAETKVRELLPKSAIKKWDYQERVIYLHNGSTIGFRSCDQDIEKFGGSAKDWIHFDEEPVGERGKRIYEECLMRTIDTRGKLWFTLTPVSGMSWTYDELYERSRFDKDIFVVEVSIFENPHLPKDEIDGIVKKLNPDEIEMRVKGKYVQLSGLVYKEFNKDKNIIESFPIPPDWKKFRGIDHGINHPTSCIWIAVNPVGEIYVYDEYCESNKTIKENCEAIRSITGGDRIWWTAIDPATESRDPQTGLTNRKEYQNNGILTRALRTDKQAGINHIKQLLMDNPASGRPTLFIFNSCYNLIKEFLRYRWRSYHGSENGKSNDVVKMNDDCLDALRYGLMSNPRYSVEEEMYGEEEEKPAWYVN
jgi:phage terminase large subunit-like protein